MLQFITSPSKFAAYFNKKVPYAYRQVTASDIKLLTECGLIKHYDFYSNTDLQTIIGILRYEQLKEKTQKQEQPAVNEPLSCKLCGKPLPPQLEGKKGRPRNYCEQCQSSRAKERYHKWKRAHSVPWHASKN